jgi:single-stranded DNA-binding protein
MSAVQYRSFIGMVQFDPVAREAAGKDVRNVTIREVGMKDQAQLISITLWPNHEAVAVKKGDLVFVDGKFEVNKGKDGEGNPKTYFNVSANAFKNLGACDYGVETESTAGDGDDGDGDDEDTW